MSSINIHGFTRCAFGVAVRDVTPPLGIYSRSWGAARHNVAAGVHRPLTASAAVLRPLTGDGAELAIVALDIGWFGQLADERQMRAAVIKATGLSESALLINMSHTHAGANVDSQRSGLPGGQMIAPYLDQIAIQVAGAIAAARADLSPAWISYGYGRCSLAANRDLWAPDLGRFVVGFNPSTVADDTVLVARVNGDDNSVRATLVNYACHPTTLAWQNQLISPDYVGAMREVLEQIYQAPVLFLYGAGGDLGPREGFVGDPDVADRNGRQLAYAAAATLEALPPPASKFVYSGVVASGANIGTWTYKPLNVTDASRSAKLDHRLIHVPLRRKPELTPVDPPDAGSADRSAEAEKALRRDAMRAALGESQTYQMPVWLWRLGDALVLASPTEAYSSMQVEIRRRFSRIPLLVMGCTNGSVGYLPPRESYGSGLYQEQQSPFAAGCLEKTIETSILELELL